MRATLKAICYKAFYSQQGHLNIIGIFDVIHASGFPATHPVMCLAFTLDNNSGRGYEYDYYIDITDSSGSKILETPLTKMKMGENGRGNLIHELRNVTFGKDGIYSANLHIGDFKESIEFE